MKIKNITGLVLIIISIGNTLYYLYNFYFVPCNSGTVPDLCKMNAPLNIIAISLPLLLIGILFLILGNKNKKK